MAKKKRRLARRPRPETRASRSGSGAPSAPGEQLPDEVEESEGGAGVTASDSELDGTEPGDDSGASQASSPVQDDSFANVSRSEEPEHSPVPLDAPPASGEPVEDAERAEDAGPPDDAEPADDAEPTDDAETADDAERAEDAGPTDDAEPADDAEGADDASRDSADRPADEDVPSWPVGPHLVGEGLSVDESEVEDTEAYLKGLVEAVIFSSDRPQTAKEVARAAKLDQRRAQELIDQLIAETRERGVRLVGVADGYAFRTNPAYSAYVREFLAQRPVRLSRAQLESLAIIAYRQPITRPEVDDIRGVDSGAVIKALLERELIRILGKKDEPGRPMIYGTTPQFLDLFSLNSLRDLPTLREFTELSDDSRAKFELEVGEPAPEGPIDVTVLSEDDGTRGGATSEKEESPGGDDGVANAEGQPTDEDTGEAQVSAASAEDEAEFPDDADDDFDDEDDEDDEIEDEDDEEANAEHATDESAASAEDEAEFPDDEDDDFDDEDDEDEDDEDAAPAAASVEDEAEFPDDFDDDDEDDADDDDEDDE